MSLPEAEEFREIIRTKCLTQEEGNALLEEEVTDQADMERVLRKYLEAARKRHQAAIKD